MKTVLALLLSVSKRTHVTATSDGRFLEKACLKGEENLPMKRAISCLNPRLRSCRSAVLAVLACLGATLLMSAPASAQNAQPPTFNPHFWLLDGNSGTDETQFLGTTDDQPLIFKVNNHQAMRYQDVENTSIPGHEFSSINVLGGSEVNTIGGGVVGATIAGGGRVRSFRSDPNQALADFVTIGGGFGNVAGGVTATVAGGSLNFAPGAQSFIGGGFENIASGRSSTVPGGNINRASGDFSFAAGFQAQANHTSTFVWSDNGPFQFASTAPNQFLIRATGGVGINTNDPSGFALKVNGSVAGVGDFVNLSDARYKQNVVTFPNALEAIHSLRGVTFDWKRNDFPNMHFAEGRQIGFIAQELETVLPELVTTDSNGYKSVAYANVVPVLVEAVKTLKAQRDTDQAELNALKAQVKEMDTLRGQLSSLTVRLTQMETENAARK